MRFARRYASPITAMTRQSRNDGSSILPESDPGRLGHEELAYLRHRFALSIS